MIVARFEGTNRAVHVLDELREMDQDDEISILNAVVVKKDYQGAVEISNDGDVRSGEGALFGALVGALVGFLGGPAGAVVGAAAGAITGGVTAAVIDFGFDTETLDMLKTGLTPNSSLIVALVEQEWSERVLNEIHFRHGQVIHQALREDFSRRYASRQRKDLNKD